MYFISVWSVGHEEWLGPFETIEAAKDHWNSVEFDANEVHGRVIGPLPVAVELTTK